jgi:hypothetical protein
MHLVVVLKVEPTHGSHVEGIFEGHCTNEVVIIFIWLVEGIGHYRWLHGSLNVLSQEQKLCCRTMCHIFNFLQNYDSFSSFFVNMSLKEQVMS